MFFDIYSLWFVVGVVVDVGVVFGVGVGVVVVVLWYFVGYRKGW